MAAVNADNCELKHAWAISVAFWLCLFCAAGLYASVALAPKFWTYLNLKNEYIANQVRLVSVERQIGYLKRVVVALESEPEFAAELARIDFDAVRPGDEHIPVDPGLTLNAPLSEPPSAVPPPTLPWYGLFVEPLARNPKLRSVILGLSVLLTIGAFTFLHESQARQLRTSLAGFRSGAGWLAQRYRKTP